jgi:hypothetical protein
MLITKPSRFHPYSILSLNIQNMYELTQRLISTARTQARTVNISRSLLKCLMKKNYARGNIEQSGEIVKMGFSMME